MYPCIFSAFLWRRCISRILLPILNILHPPNIFFPLLWKAFLANSTVNMGRYCSPEQVLLTQGSPKYYSIFQKIFQDIQSYSGIFWDIPRYLKTYIFKILFTLAEWCSLAWNIFLRQVGLDRPRRSTQELQGFNLVCL